MKVLFQIRPGYKDGVAGDSIQMVKTMAYLRELGVDVSVSTQQNISLREFDIIHIFNCTRIPEAYGFYKNAINQKKKVVISPIFIDMNQYYKGNNAKFAAWRAENILRREMLQGSNMLLPNSKKELEWIQNILFVDSPSMVIYHGVDNLFSNGDPEWFYTQYGLKDFILCVGRLSPIKNQLSLIRAVKDLSIPIVLIGPVNNKQYAIKCAEETDCYIKYIPFLKHEELASAYKAASVHVQPSWFETVGLASLEAAAAGTQVVITQRGAANEYFGNKVRYIDPDDLDSIRQAVIAAIEDKEKNDLQQYTLANYSWERTAQATLEAYDKVLADEGSHAHAHSWANGNERVVNQGNLYSQTYPLF